MQLLRVKFSRGNEIKFISHLDIMRLWERALRRALVPLAYSEGFNPHPCISLAAPLAVGITSETELMDIFFNKPVTPHWFVAITNQQLPTGLKVLQANQIPPNMPSLQSQIRFTEYVVEIETNKEVKDIESAIHSLLSVEHLPWHHERDTGRHSYDLRVLIDDLWLIKRYNSYCTIGMRLRCDNTGSGRAEQVIAALGFTSYPQSIHRTKLILEV